MHLPFDNQAVSIYTRHVYTSTQQHKLGHSGHSERVNISLPKSLRKVSTDVVKSKGFGGLSDYVQAYLRKDAAALGMHQFHLSE